MEFRIDRNAGLPVYLQLVRQVREALRLGWLEPGSRLPTVRDVVSSSGVNANTVLKAYRELELSGLVETRHGSGTFVTASLGCASQEDLTQLRKQLAEWVSGARTAGLDNEDIEALMRAVLMDKGVGD